MQILTAIKQKILDFQCTGEPKTCYPPILQESPCNAWRSAGDPGLSQSLKNSKWSQLKTRTNKFKKKNQSV